MNDEFVEQVGKAIIDALIAADFEVSHMRDHQQNAAAIAAIAEMAIRLLSCPEVFEGEANLRTWISLAWHQLSNSRQSFPAEIERLRRLAQQPFADPTGLPPAADRASKGADALTGEAPVASAPTNAQSPLRRAETLRLELEKIAWMDEFLDAAGAREMMNIARDAVRADESTVTKTVLCPDAGGK